MRHPDDPGGAARHLRRAGAPGGDRAPAAARRHRGRAACRCTSSSPSSPWSTRGLTNYWGYNTIGFFAPHNGYSSAGAARRAGRRVQDHGQGAARGRHRGDPRRGLQPHRRGRPPAARRCRFRGIDNAAYYRLDDGDPRRYMDYTGCGNTLNVRHPHALQLIMDSLRYWVLEMHVDGFRFDLAAALARELHDVDRLSAFFDLVQQDPVVSQVKLIAEPWDVGRGRLPGRQLPAAVDASGTASTGTPCATSGAASPSTLARVRLPAHRVSATCTQTSGRRPVASVNFVTVPRRLHPGRPGLLQRQAQRGQRRGQPGRHRRQPVLELRRRGPDRRPGRPRAARPAAAQLPGHPAAVAGRPDAAGRRRDGPHPAAATTTPTARTTRSPGWTGPAAAEAADLLEFTADAGPAAPRPPGVPAPPVLPRPARPRRRDGCGDIGWLTPAGRGDDRRRTGGAATPSRWRCS